jgi:L-histidine N-alpha-methyltransferase
LIELGAGDGLKTKQLLKQLQVQEFDFNYLAIDISQNALNDLERSLKAEFPELSMKTLCGDYFEVLESLQSDTPKVILFLGSNIGNLTDELAKTFFENLSVNLNNGDSLVLGVDLVKPKSIVLPAYNDKAGVTAAFNLNLLERINTELNGDFNLDAFVHEPVYDEVEQIAKSYMVSTKNQFVNIKYLNKSYCFEIEEKIQMEISRKYNDVILNRIIKNTPFKIGIKLTDEKHFFANYILKVS